MPADNNYIKKLGRVLYVDPNDVFGSINGVPMTPDYSDMCISFKLECRVLPRYKQNITIGETNVIVNNKDTKQDEIIKYSLNWNTSHGDLGENQWVSFLQGDLYNKGKDSFLTTYYTDINYDDYAKKTIVEGLGVENVTVSYENYYTPTISIKFVDHRGSALFGREEAVHYDDKITIDSIFGAFFTAPYPLFRMQIKGFYGRAVTYQMTCTGFKGSLNSKTGNFEAVATFIGYSYSLLTDIPFEYIVAAPYCEYVGKDYWDSKKGGEEWRMYWGVEGDEVPTLFELFQRITACFTNESLLQVISNEEKEVSATANNEVNTLYSMLSIYESLFNIIKHRLVNTSDTDNYIIHRSVHGYTEQYLYMLENMPSNDWTEIETLWKSLTSLIQTYNETYEDSPLTEDTFPQVPQFSKLFVRRLFNVNKDNTISLYDVKEATVNELLKLRINGVQLNEPLCEEILDFIKKPNALDFVKPNVVAIDWGYFKEVIENRISELTTTVKEINRKTERNYLHLAVENLGIVPYIGNIFKLVMCHVETFIEIMHQCYLNIEIAKAAGERKPYFLNIPAESTDVVSRTRDYDIPAWPQINKSNDTSNYYLMLEKEDTFGWLGDFSDDFEEVKLVKALYLACERTAADPQKIDPQKQVEYLYVPILPCDVNNNFNPFLNGKETISSLGGMVGIRIAQIFGVAEGKKIEEELAKTLGKVDALNYYRFLGSKSKLKSIIEQCDENLADALYNIMLCKPSADKYGNVDEGSNTALQDFEFAKGMFKDIQRHPIFIEKDSEKLNYTYLVTKSKYGIIPSNTRSNDFLKEYVATSDGRCYFNCDITPDNNYLRTQFFLHYCNSTQLFSDYKKPEERIKHINNEMYYIVSDTPTIDSIYKRYEEMLNGKVTVLGETFEVDTLNILMHYWTFMAYNVKYLYETEALGYFSKPYSESGIEEKMLLGDKFDTSTDVIETFKKLYGLTYAKFNRDGIIYDDKEINLNELVIPVTECVIGKNWYSLFGVDFYYLQNKIENTETKNKVKALLFLHTLFYNTELLMSWDFIENTSAVINQVPFGFAALCGGLLWRHNYIMTNHQDPIQYGTTYQPAYDKKNNVEYTLFDIDVNNKRRLHPEKTNGKYKYRVFSDGTSKQYVFKHNPDYIVANELIRIFEQFISNQWQTICKLELRKKDGTSFKDGNDFASFVRDFKQTTKEHTNGKSGDELIKARAEARKEVAEKFVSFTDNYCFLTHDLKITDGNSDDKLLLYLNTNNKAMQDALRSTYLGRCVELRTMSSYLDVNNKSVPDSYSDIRLYTSNVKSYLNGFADMLKGIIGESTEESIVKGKDSETVEDTPEFNRETALPIYMYLKAIWDKWLVAMDMDNHEFMVKNFHNNFVFIDSFYRNIGHRFMVNCQLMLDCYNQTSSTTDTTVFKYLTDLVNKHQLMFVGLPDFVSGLVSNGLGGQKHTLDVMSTMFKPISYEQMNPMENTNKFAIIYIPRLSEIPSEINGYKNDSFDIVDYGSGKGAEKAYNFPDILKDETDLNDESMFGLYLDYGYFVPSFGLVYGRQNNHIFKSINLTMETPVITSTVINTLSHTARLGANSTHKVAYIGQDIYPVFSNYSYICEFEMMGCAQIQPLMYFQLMNVPMWRGTYIIFSVNHIMTPGNMVTKVKAMKLSCKAVPYSNAWFTENPRFDPDEYRKQQCLEDFMNGKIGISASLSNAPMENVTPTTDDGNTYGSGIFSGKTMAEQLAICEVKTSMSGSQVKPLIANCTYRGGVGGKKSYTVQVNKHVVEDLQAIANEVAALGWFNFYISSAWRPGNKAYGHRLGIAVDINCPDNGAVPNPWFNHHFCVNGPEPDAGAKLGYPMKKYKEPSHGYDRTKCIWYYNHPVAKIFRAHGWNWGGQFGDVMHFDLRGQSCASGGSPDPGCPSKWWC